MAFQSFFNISFFPLIFYPHSLLAAFIITFNLLAFGTQKIGIAISTVANKMSMIIPVIIGIYLFKEDLGVLKLLGFTLAISAIYMTSTKSGKLSFDKKFMPIILLIFLGQGMADGTLSWAQKFTSPQTIHLYFLHVHFFLLEY